MSIFDPIVLLEWTWAGGTVYRQALAGGDVTWGGFTWLRDHPQIGVCSDVEGVVEGGSEISARDIDVSVTTFLQAEYRAGRVNQTLVKVREAERELNGAITVKPFVWDGFVSNASSTNAVGTILKMECAGQLARDALVDETSTYGPLSRQRLVAGDTAFNRIGGKVMENGQVPGGGGIVSGGGGGGGRYTYENEYER
jgi:hypothetical protein